MNKTTDSAGKVVIVTNYSFPDSAATANRVSTIANEIATECNLDVVVVGPGPNEVMEGSITKVPKNYDIVSVFSSAFSRNNLFLRAFGELRQAWDLLKAAKDENADVYIVSIPSIFLILAVVFLKSRPIIFDFRDLVWDYYIELGGLHTFAGTIMKSLLPSILRRAKAITVTNSSEKRELSPLTRVPITIVGNGISQDHFERLNSLKPPSQCTPFVVLYIGNLGMAQNLETLLEAVGGDEQFEINLIGSGAKADFLLDFVHQSEMTNVKFTGALQWSDTLVHIEQANCLYGQIGTSFNSAIPSKLYEYLSCSRPVVFGLPDGAAKNLFSDFEDISICTPNSPKELREKLLRLKHDAGIKTSSIQSNRNRIRQHHLRENQTKNLVTIVQSLVKKDIVRQL